MASTSSCRTPSPLAYMSPRKFCAPGWPCSAARRYHAAGFNAFARKVQVPSEAGLRGDEVLLRGPSGTTGRLQWCPTARLYRLGTHSRGCTARGRDPARQQAEPPDGFSGIRQYALTGGVHPPEVVLRAGVTLLGSQAEPPNGFSGIRQYALTGGVHPPKAVLGVGVTRLCSGAQVGNRLCCRWLLSQERWNKNREAKGGSGGDGGAYDVVPHPHTAAWVSSATAYHTPDESPRSGTTPSGGASSLAAPPLRSGLPGEPTRPPGW